MNKQQFKNVDIEAFNIGLSEDTLDNAKTIEILPNSKVPILLAVGCRSANEHAFYNLLTKLQDNQDNLPAYYHQDTTLNYFTTPQMQSNLPTLYLRLLGISPAFTGLFITSEPDKAYELQQSLNCHVAVVVLFDFRDDAQAVRRVLKEVRKRFAERRMSEVYLGRLTYSLSNEELLIPKEMASSIAREFMVIYTDFPVFNIPLFREYFCQMALQEARSLRTYEVKTQVNSHKQFLIYDTLGFILVNLCCMIEAELAGELVFNKHFLFFNFSNLLLLLLTLSILSLHDNFFLPLLARSRMHQGTLYHPTLQLPWLTRLQLLIKLTLLIAFSTVILAKALYDTEGAFAQWMGTLFKRYLIQLACIGIPYMIVFYTEKCGLRHKLINSYKPIFK
ncbi:hypothetical protein FGO68_gene16125 [Halteria grandinella]|uniref:Uncharacterized protein n=1 Tax=Halteria grandinella TaxID=5974 RepID=A0A8J8T148_HALGN|nr:hypothetical protein FGO68_gene16125 [Halteria grandinella]